ncbi:hypothetical protein [Streptomyces sp. NRRL F-4474]|uniref:hypothetical protein n=1 Tax=Streptomyces sp. NRRL F-4474 TaxID=1463851 RepID=UPI0004C7DF48|nr:hypothetical protein [Streptomyces sp. NRRL F-4474]
MMITKRSVVTAAVPALAFSLPPAAHAAVPSAAPAPAAAAVPQVLPIGGGPNRPPAHEFAALERRRRRWCVPEALHRLVHDVLTHRDHRDHRDHRHHRLSGDATARLLTGWHPS